MVLKKTNSRVYIINLFSDFLLTKIPHSEESIFSVIDCNNFVIIKGKTTHKEILDISSITKEFNEKYEPSKPISHTIDLIEYGSKLPKVKNLEFYNIPTNYTDSSIIFNLSLDKNEENENIISIFNVDKNSEDEKLKSAILDVFDFDMSSISSEMKKVDWSIELTNPLEDYSFVKKKNKDFIIF